MSVFSPVRAAASLSLAASLALAAALAAAQTSPSSRARAQQGRDTIPNEDLRCLTRRPQDCLGTPVPRGEPHRAICATCHNLWDKAVPAHVTKSCTAEGCHSGAAPLSAFHATVRPEALADCVHCHRPHDFRVPKDGNECAACHRGGGTLVEWAPPPARKLVAPYSAFSHARHASVGCERCHGTQDSHGTLVVTSIGECRACHHRPPLSNRCARCHSPDSMSAVVLPVTRSLNIRIGSLDRPLRVISFEHAKHAALGCAECHTMGSDLRAATGADCSGCHLRHHEPTSDCSKCHQPPAQGAHTLDVHMGCAGVGCHDPAPDGVKSAPRTRQLCLACHRDQREHRPGRACADCHRLPPAGAPGA